MISRADRGSLSWGRLQGNGYVAVYRWFGRRSTAACASGCCCGSRFAPTGMPLVGVGAPGPVLRPGSRRGLTRMSAIDPTSPPPSQQQAFELLALELGAKVRQSGQWSDSRNHIAGGSRSRASSHASAFAGGDLRITPIVSEAAVGHSRPRASTASHIGSPAAGATPLPIIAAKDVHC